ncbi:hypothetical protein LOK74_15170 [Brevibacillus humidisoli]|uniref:hypothetical protein n=1 Tax=Brevibacillus humidisoli TaxID=2895522 RepID=UPI001E293878|nr:hypothetical protein [Brevibacillus humidisoli]UFJ39406.1 hypothetical protein LOK74_15170 [Brevibacillus humidisoli]
MSEVCPSCGRLKRANQEFCSSCWDGETRDYRAVKAYLRTHPNSNAMQIANATGVSVSKIMRYIRDGALMTDRS